MGVLMRPLHRWIVAIAIVVGLGAAALTLPINDWLLGLVSWIRAAGAGGVAVYAVVYVAATLLLLPGSALTASAGFAYGPLWGTLVASPVSVLAATLAFVLGRTVARGWVARRMSGAPRFAAVDEAIGQSGLKIVTLLRLSPLFPFNLLNYGLGLTRVRFRDYVIGSFLGMLPGTALYVYLGSLVTSASELLSGRSSDVGTAGQVLYWTGLVATLAVTVLVSRIAKQALDRAIATATSAVRPPQLPSLEGVPSVSTEALPPTTLQPARAPEGALQGLILPDDAHNRELVANAHPSRWKSPEAGGRYNLVVVGAGTAGLVSALGAAGLGARVAIVERHLMGGDCLNFGCVPSKGILRAAHAAHDVRSAGSFGVEVNGEVRADFGAAMERMRRLRAGISRNDSAHRLKEHGVDVFLGDATFTGPDTLEVDGRRLHFRRAVIATGARAASLPIPGLAEAGYLTNETVFSLTELPRRLVVIGAGPIGCELTQAFRRFGAEVTIVSLDPRLLPREDPDAAAIMMRAFEREGVELALGAHLVRVERDGLSKVVIFDRGQGEERAAGDEILLAVGRTPNTEGLGLEAAGVAFGRAGVEVDDRLRTSNKRIYAAGDICSVYKFTHAADAMARIVLQNALFFGRKKASALHIPWATFTDPEVAHVGLYEHEAKERGFDVRTYTVELSEVDRALLDGDTEGFARVHVDGRSGRLLGATLVARHAGDMLGEPVLAMTEGLRIDALSRAIAPYPTQGEVWKRLGDAHQRTRLSPAVKSLFEWMFRWWR